MGSQVEKSSSSTAEGETAPAMLAMSGMDDFFADFGKNLLALYVQYH